MSRLPAALACWLALAVPGVAAAAEVTADSSRRPLWEFGLGVGTLGYADYRGSDTSHLLALPLPYFIYRGRFLRADRDGVRGVLLNHRRVELNVSVGATTPVRSGSNAARQGMPGLQSTLEMGPSLDLHLWRSDTQRARLDLRLPATLSVTLEAHPQAIGWQFAPRLNLDLINIGGERGWSLGMLAGPVFAERRYHNYFYQVLPGFAAAGRPAYASAGGFAGVQTVIALSRRFPRYWFGAFARYDSLRGAVFADSPLVRSDHYWMAGAGIAWMIGQSSRVASDAERP